MLADINVADIVKKWEPVLNFKGLPTIKDGHKRNMTAILLENTEKALMESGAHSNYQLMSEDTVPSNNMSGINGQGGGTNIDTFDPILISLIRRTAPNLVAYDLCGVQPMTGPTGIIFAMRPFYSNTTNGAIGEAWYNEVSTAWSTVVSGANTAGDKHVGTMPGNTSVAANLAETGLYNWGGGMALAQAEALGADSNAAFAQMSFTI